MLIAAKPDPFDFQIVMPQDTAVGAALELSVLFKANPQLSELVWHIPDLDEPLYGIIPPAENRTETRDQSSFLWSSFSTEVRSEQ